MIYMSFGVSINFLEAYYSIGNKRQFLLWESNLSIFLVMLNTIAETGNDDLSPHTIVGKIFQVFLQI